MPDKEVSVRSASPGAPRLANALARSFELVAGIALFALTATALIVALVPSSSSARTGFAIELVFVGLGLVVLALLLSRRSALAVKEPLEVLESALSAVTAGDLGVRVDLDRAAAEIQEVGASVNTMVRELARLHVVEVERTKDQRVQRELSEVVHSSLDLVRVVQRAVIVVGEALDVDRVHIRLRERDGVRLVAEWRRAGAVPAIVAIAPDDELAAVRPVLGVTDDRSAVVINDALDPARFGVEQRRDFAALSVSAALKYPIVVGADVAGALVVSQESGARSWTGSEVTLMEGFAREIGSALDHALAFRLQFEMVERLGVLDRSKNEFLVEISRKLRGPLASLVGYIEVLVDGSAGALTPEQRQMLDAVVRGGDRLLAVSADLLAVAEIEAGEFTPKYGPVDLAGVVRRACEAASDSVATGSLELEARVEPGLVFVADEVQVERALRNLVLNAVTFTNPGGRVEVAVRSDGPEVVIEVCDSGVGIPPEVQPDLFTRFFTASGERRRQWMGGGLGLFVVKEIADGHGGSVTVASEPGKGSEFTMRFPARPQHARRRVSDRALGRARPADLVVT